MSSSIASPSTPSLTSSATASPFSTHARPSLITPPKSTLSSQSTPTLSASSFGSARLLSMPTPSVSFLFSNVSRWRLSGWRLSGWIGFMRGRRWARGVESMSLGLS
ncbi:hypothetical protein Droror1_Dr00021521 [Drosera rotundifolia]